MEILEWLVLGQAAEVVGADVERKGNMEKRNWERVK